MRTGLYLRRKNAANIGDSMAANALFGPRLAGLEKGHVRDCPYGSSTRVLLSEFSKSQAGGLQGSDDNVQQAGFAGMKV